MPGAMIEMTAPKEPMSLVSSQQGQKVGGLGSKDGRSPIDQCERSLRKVYTYPPLRCTISKILPHGPQLASSTIRRSFIECFRSAWIYLVCPIEDGGLQQLQAKICSAMQHLFESLEGYETNLNLTVSGPKSQSAQAPKGPKTPNRLKLVDSALNLKPTLNTSYQTSIGQSACPNVLRGPTRHFTAQCFPYGVR